MPSECMLRCPCVSVLTFWWVVVVDVSVDSRALLGTRHLDSSLSLKCTRMIYLIVYHFPHYKLCSALFSEYKEKAQAEDLKGLFLSSSAGLK